jgi:hypothetical protein
MEKIFAKGKLEDVEQRQIFPFKFYPKIKKLCVMRDYVNMDALLTIALEVEWVLVELEEIPFELLRVEHEDGVVANVVEKQVDELNDSFIKNN